MDKEKAKSTRSIETIEHDGEILAHIFKSSLDAEGVKFLTPDEYTLQLGLLEHPSGTILKTHRHNPDIEYEVNTTQEFLYLESGRLRVTYYSEDWDQVAQFELGEGDFMLHVKGGHGFEILEDCRVIEVKQGPFPGAEKAKIYPE